MIEKLQEQLKAMEGIYMQIAKAVRETDPEHSFRTFGMAETCRKAAEEMERLKPAEIEIEGGGTTWWHVCSECRTNVDTGDKFCRNCGRPLTWEGTTSGNTQD